LLLIAVNGGFIFLSITFCQSSAPRPSQSTRVSYFYASLSGHLIFCYVTYLGLARGQ